MKCPKCDKEMAEHKYEPKLPPAPGGIESDKVPSKLLVYQCVCGYSTLKKREQDAVV